MVTKTRLTLDEFLALPETEPPSELICGEVVQKPMPNTLHGLLTHQLSLLLGVFLRGTRRAVVTQEVRHAVRAEGRAYLPDVSVTLLSRYPRDARIIEHGPLEVPPDIAIEVLSPDDRPGRVAEKLAFYLRVGVPLVWVVDPMERSLAAHRPGAPSTFHQAPEVIDAAPVLPDFRLDLAELFGVLDILGEQP